jgi:hypothetical protein
VGNLGAENTWVLLPVTKERTASENLMMMLAKIDATNHSTTRAMITKTLDLTMVSSPTTKKYYYDDR